MFMYLTVSQSAETAVAKKLDGLFETQVWGSWPVDGSTRIEFEIETFLSVEELQGAIWAVTDYCHIEEVESDWNDLQLEQELDYYDQLGI